MVTHLEDEPASEIDTADRLRPIRKPRGKGMLRDPSKAMCGKNGDEEQRGKHRRLWQLKREVREEEERAGKEGRGEESENGQDKDKL